MVHARLYEVGTENTTDHRSSTQDNKKKDITLPGSSDYKRPQKEAHALVFGDFHPNISAALVIELIFCHFCNFQDYSFFMFSLYYFNL